MEKIVKQMGFLLVFSCFLSQSRFSYRNQRHCDYLQWCVCAL